MPDSDPMPRTLAPLANVSDSDPRTAAAIAGTSARYREGNLAEAEKLCREFLSSVGGNTHIYNTLGVVLRAQHKPADAVPAYRESLKLDPSNAAAWSNLSNALDALNNLPEALEAGREALRLEPDNETFRRNLDKVQNHIRQASDAREPFRVWGERPRILFVSHEASRTGAPLLLLTFLRWLKVNADIDFETLVKGHADWRIDKKEQLELVPDFEALAPTMVWYKRADNRVDKGHINELKTRIRNTKFDMIFANTICNGEVLAELCPGFDGAVISYVHELEYSIRCNPPKHVTSVLKYTTHFVAGSRVVRDNLNKAHGIATSRLHVVPSFIDIVDHKPGHPQEEIRRQLGIPDDAHIINACATVEWRKGPELFILLANAVRKRGGNRNIHFVWVGNPINLSFYELRYDLRRMGLEDRVHFIGAHPNFRDYLAAADAFTLVSREDPFPLVVLEAALLRRPVLCFDRGGGAPEFVEEDCGFVVPYLDIEAMADRIIELVDDPGLRESQGRRGADKVRERHDAAIGSSQLLNIINTTLNWTSRTETARSPT